MRTTVVSVVAIAIAAGVACGGSQVPRGPHHADQTIAMPAELDPASHHTGDVRVAKVRVLADADYRAHTPRWQQQITDQVDYANALLTPLVGVRLEIIELRAWDHTAPDGSLREALAAATAAEPGDDVAWVIAFTAPLPIASTAFDELGLAELLGNHVVVRAYADEPERVAFAKAFPQLPLGEAGDAIEARRRHKQTCLLLHQLGHALGAIHETDAAWLMHLAYDPQQTTVSDRNRELIQLAIDDRVKLKELRNRDATAVALLGAIERADWGGWVPAEKDDETAALRATIAAAQKGATALDVPPAIAAQYQRAEQLMQNGRKDAALAELEPLIAAYPGNAQVRLLACKVQLTDKGPPSDAARDVCNRAAELAQGDPSPHLALAAAYAAAGDKPHARAELALAAARVGNLADGKPATWASIAALAQQLGDVTHAEDALIQAGGDASANPIGQWVKRTRARYGDPRDGARWHVTPDDEADYLDAVRKILDLVYASKYAQADAAARAADHRWPGAPGIAAARCDLELRQAQKAAATAHCKAAIAAFPGDSWAQYLYGILQLEQRDPGPGIASLQRAIAADPELGEAWRALAKGLERAGARADLARLRTDYQAAFGQALP